VIVYERGLVLLASLIFLLVYFKGGTSVFTDTQRSMNTAAGRAYMIAAVLMALATLGIILPTQVLVCAGILRGWSWGERASVVTLGTLLAVAGISAVFWIRYRYLGRFWSGSVEIQKGHEVVDHGPYRVMRHPLYAASVVIYLGVALAFATWWNLIACGVMIVAYVWLTVHEDQFLAAHLPGYREYQERTPHRLVPGMW
jgi:protein-S-isoprenylcysteine O-methyltransferase Ste14